MTECLAFKEELPSWYAPDGGGRGDEAQELNTVAHFAKSVQGWLSDSQGLALYQRSGDRHFLREIDIIHRPGL